MSCHRTICLFILVGLGTLASGIANGQVDKNQKGGGQPEVSAADEIQEARMDVQFQGGTIEEFVKHVRQRNPAANILVSESAGNVILPAIEMKNVTVDHTLVAVEMLTNRQPNSASVEMIPDGRKKTWVVSTEHSVEPLEIVVQVINARVAIDTFDDETASKQLTLTIDEGLDTVFGDSPPVMSIKLHSETGLLFIKGREDKVEFVMQIIRELEKNQVPGFEALSPQGLPGGRPDPASGANPK